MELDSVKKECSRMSLKRALLSAIASAVPLPFTDIAADVALLKEILPKINNKFGLSKEQIDEYDPRLAIFIYDISKKLGKKMIGRYVTEELAVRFLKKLGLRLAAKQAAKYVPIAGQVISAAISFTVMRLIIRCHINECYEVAAAIIESGKGRYDRKAWEH